MGFIYIYPIGSMVLLYLVCHGSHQQKPTFIMLAYIPAPWIRHGYIYIYGYTGVHHQPKGIPSGKLT